MPLTKPPCSEPHLGQHPVLVLEGMPGAGKTTAADILVADNRMVIGEYTTPTAETIPVQTHPAVADDAAHQRNWLRKHHQIQTARRAGPVCCDRDWLTALAYAHSIADTDDGALLVRRAHWVTDHLNNGHLTVATSYVIFLLCPVVSLRRRAHRLTPQHPWSSLPGLVRLAAFYVDPVAAVASAHPELAARLRTATWHQITGYSIDQTVRLIRDLLDRR